MPVRQRSERSSRSVLIGVAGLALGIIAVLALFVLAIPTLTEDGHIEARLGDPMFTVGRAETRAASVSADGPIIFQDVAGGQRDIYVQHIGDDPTTGWYAFDARRPGIGRECTLVWDADGDEFTDPCDDDSTVSADGEGLRQYIVVVDEDGIVAVDLRDAPEP